SAVTPPGTAGAVDVVVTNPAGSDTAVGAFTYVAGPGI
ncbi:cell surface protein, partial [Streptomyces sp. D2-8]|nr:cell surface protein [Streptomyces sp. D2-8]MCK8438939.1 cell surface protein [Streptomyces sp. D2-8]